MTNMIILIKPLLDSENLLNVLREIEVIEYEEIRDFFY